MCRSTNLLLKKPPTNGQMTHLFIAIQCILIIQINISGFSAQYHIPLHPQVTLSLPPLQKKHAPKSSSTRMQKTWDSAPNITSPCIRKSLSPWHLSNRLINPDALLWALDQSPKQHHLSIIKSYPTLKTTGLTILHTPAFKTTGSPPPLLQQQHPKCPSSSTEKSGLISSSTTV